MSKLSATELKAQQARYDELMGYAGTVQCAGCQYESRVRLGRPQHLDDCEECSLHCICFRIPDGT